MEQLAAARKRQALEFLVDDPVRHRGGPPATAPRRGRFRPRLALAPGIGRSASAVLVALSILLAAGERALAAEAWEREYARDLASPDSNVRLRAVRSLDPAAPRGREALLAVLDREPWFLREAAIERLAAAPAGAIADLAKHVEKHASPYVREGLVRALARSGEPAGRAAALAGADDKHPMVRRAVAIGVGASPAREGIDALVLLFEREKDVEVRSFVRDALEEATGQSFDLAADWKNWWAESREKWEPGGAPRAGRTTTTELRDVSLEYYERGNGAPLFVLPDIYRNRRYLKNHLAPLVDVARLFFIDLPAMGQFKGLETVGGTGVPYYPVDKLADAFDELRAARKEDRIALLAHGRSAWVAMRYASRHPKTVSHLILVAPWSGTKAWWAGRDRIEGDARQRKDIEQERYAQWQIVVDLSTGKHKYEPADDAEKEALERVGWGLFFADARSPFAGLWYRSSWRDMGGTLIPDLDVAREKTSPVPTLLVVGTHPRSFWTSAADMKAIQKVYPNSEVAEFAQSANMPMIEEPERFQKVLRAFFKKHRFKR